MTDSARLPSGPEMAAEVISEAGKPVHVKVIAAEVLKRDRKRPKASRAYHGKTPDQTISAQLTVSHGKGGTFERVAPGVFALRSMTKAQKAKAPKLPEGFKVRQPGSGGARKPAGDGLPAGSVVVRQAQPARKAASERKVREAAKGRRPKPKAAAASA